MKGKVYKSTNFQPTKGSMTNSGKLRAGNLSKSARYPPLTQKSKEDDYIASLQKQVYYLELEMKLMKDREIDTKNKVGGYEVLFRDGVPLNENFLALKTKYKNERDNFENMIRNLDNTITRTDEENQNLQMQIEQTNKNYYDIIQKINSYSDDYTHKLFDINGKLFNEVNTLSSLNSDKDKLGRDLFRFTSENTQHNRTLEKNALFKEDNGDKNEKLRKHNENKFADIDKLTERSILELDTLERKLMDNNALKQLEDENMNLLQKITKLERDSHMAQAKISEIENAQALNKKHLLDEELTRNIHLHENEKLNDILDGLSKLNEEKLKEKVKESEERQSLVIKNQIANAELKMGLLLTKYKEKEAEARNLLEEKNSLLQKNSQLKDDIDNQNEQEEQVKMEIIDVKNNINQLEDLINDSNNKLETLVDENNQFKMENEKYESDIKNLKIKIEEIQQKIELNTMLKDIDVNELKMLSQNNAIVNNNINNLISKWDKVHAKLEEIEKKDKENQENQENNE